MRSSAGYGVDYNRSPLSRCRSTGPRPGRTASVHRSCYAACTGYVPELVAQVKYLTWTDDNLLRQVVYEGLREDKDPPAAASSAPRNDRFGGSKSNSGRGG